MSRSNVIQLPVTPAGRAAMRALLLEAKVRRVRGRVPVSDKAAALLLYTAENRPRNHMAIVNAAAACLGSSMHSAFSWCLIHEILPIPHCVGCRRLLDSGGYRFRLTPRSGTIANCHPHCPEPDVLEGLVRHFGEVKSTPAELDRAWEEVQRRLRDEKTKKPPRDSA